MVGYFAQEKEGRFPQKAGYFLDNRSDYLLLKNNSVTERLDQTKPVSRDPNFVGS
jgi:hypothetical protein